MLSLGQFFALLPPTDMLAHLNQPDGAGVAAVPAARYKCGQSVRAACECWLGERLTRLKRGSLVFRHQHRAPLILLHSYAKVFFFQEEITSWCFCFAFCLAVGLLCAPPPPTAPPASGVTLSLLVYD